MSEVLIPLGFRPAGCRNLGIEEFWPVAEIPKFLIPGN